MPGPTPFPLGRRVQFDEKSRGFAAFGARTIRSRVRHRVSGSRLNQGEVGACTGFALVACRNTAPNRVLYEESFGSDVALRVYSLATRLDPFPGYYPPEDTGSSGLAACKAGVRLGLISSYQWCFGLDHLITVLARRPVIAGTTWFSTMFEPDATGRVRVEGDEVGGHEWLINGYDRIERVIFGVNSWGRGWGKNGCFVVGFDDMARLLKMDGDLKVPIR